jgi:hypothetical protein
MWPLVRTDVSEERIDSIIRVTSTANFVPGSPIPVTLIVKAIRFSELSVLTRATRRNVPEDGIILLYVIVDVECALD